MLFSHLAELNSEFNWVRRHHHKCVPYLEAKWRTIRDHADLDLVPLSAFCEPCAFELKIVTLSKLQFLHVCIN